MTTFPRPTGPRLPLTTPIVLLLALAACTAGPGDPSPDAVIDTLPNGAIRIRTTEAQSPPEGETGGLRLVEVARIGRFEGQGPDVFGRIGSIAEDAAGQIWIADATANDIRIFDRAGAYIRTVGRPGEGPGEFGRIGGIHPGPDGNIWVDDAVLRRWEVFNTAGERVAGHPGNSNVGGGIRRWSIDGRLIEVNMDLSGGPLTIATIESTPPIYAIRTLGPGGELVPGDTIPGIALPETEIVHFTRDGRGVMSRPVPFTHLPSVVLGYHGEFWVSEGGGPYIIRRQSFEGDTLLVIERAYEPIPVSDPAREEALKLLAPPEGMASEDNDPARVPAVYPPFRGLYPATDGKLWVFRELGPNQVGLEAFSSEGAFLGRISMEGTPERNSPRLITGEHLYLVEADEFGIEQVVVYRIPL